MSTTIYYFTGTGNCLKVARDLAKELGDTKIVSIPRVIDLDLDLSADSIGIVFPVYMFGMPLIVSRFIQKLELSKIKDKYVFVVATFAGTSGSALYQAEKEINSRGLRLSLGSGIKMPGNYTPLAEALPEDKQNQMFDIETRKVSRIAGLIRNKNISPIEKGNAVFNGFISSLVFNWLKPKIFYMDKEFWVDDKCNGCGTCVKVCPVNNIKLISDKPAWMHKCEQCFACLQWCPKEAIQCGKNTAKRKR